MLSKLLWPGGRKPRLKPFLAPTKYTIPPLREMIFSLGWASNPQRNQTLIPHLWGWVSYSVTSYSLLVVELQLPIPPLRNILIPVSLNLTLLKTTLLPLLRIPRAELSGRTFTVRRPSQQGGGRFYVGPCDSRTSCHIDIHLSKGYSCTPVCAHLYKAKRFFLCIFARRQCPGAKNWGRNSRSKDRG